MQRLKVKLNAYGEINNKVSWNYVDGIYLIEVVRILNGNHPGNNSTVVLKDQALNEQPSYTTRLKR